MRLLTFSQGLDLITQRAYEESNWPSCLVLGHVKILSPARELNFFLRFRRHHLEASLQSRCLAERWIRPYMYLQSDYRLEDYSQKILQAKEKSTLLILHERSYSKCNAGRRGYQPAPDGRV